MSSPLVRCPYCGTIVLPRSDGACPQCKQPIAAPQAGSGEPGQVRATAQPGDVSDDAQRPSQQAPAAPKMSPVTEIAVFAICFGLLMLVAAYLFLTMRGRLPDLWGFKRQYALGVPVLFLGVGFLASGASLLATKGERHVVICMILGILTTLLYSAWMISALGTIPVTLVSLVVYALPVLLIVRGRKAMIYIIKTRADTSGSSRRQG